MQETLLTERLQLRPFAPGDALPLAAIGNDRRVALSTGTIPHPYRQEHAAEWIARHAEWFMDGAQTIWAVTLRGDAADAIPEGTLIGTLGFVHERLHQRDEVGYWIGHAFWGRGYATEACRAAIRWNFETQGVHRIFGTHFATNPASGRVLQKCGMRQEGVLRQHYVRFEIPHDLVQWGILREEWEAGNRKF